MKVERLWRDKKKISVYPEVEAKKEAKTVKKTAAKKTLNFNAFFYIHNYW
jgi:hypothetical protein